MYETEINNRTESGKDIPSDVRRAMMDAGGRILARTVLPWSEHCTECVWPSCYSTCDLYSPREDGRCRRFVDGMVKVAASTGLQAYLVKIRFKRWGKLWTPGNVHLYPTAKAQQIERRDSLIGAALVQLPLPSELKKKITGKRYGFKKKMASKVGHRNQWPTCFLIECFNPAAGPVRLSLTMRAADAKTKIPFQRLIELMPGFQRVRIPIEQIACVLDVDAPFSVDLIPDSEENETTLFFGLMDFVQEAALPLEQEKAGKVTKIKCVVWDLDNTLWDGILVEDGPAKLALKDGIANIIQSLDQRGILQSVATKNNQQDALQMLKQFHLDEYFLYPQISWQPKSESMRAIASQLNIGLDTLLFVDDAPFELEEVKLRCPEVRTFDARQYRALLDMEELNVQVTVETKSRRAMYHLETERHKSAEEFGTDYMSFLKHCEIELSLGPLTQENLNRVHELTQRTNQMNFSGNRYDRETLENVLRTPYLDTYVMSCQDRFGTYGVIGFSLVDRREPRMTDLMFSCRVQSKRVEHAFLAYVLSKYISETGKDFYASYHKTSRNAPSGRVFDDVGMEEMGVQDGVINLAFRRNQFVPDDQLIRVSYHAPMAKV